MPKSSKRKGRKALVFQKWNYILLLIGIALIVVGFSAMALEGQFKGFISLYISPILIVGGYAEIVYAILWRPDSEAQAQEA
jgi:uncharacterized membrane protein HdeD (DUF308 family)